LNSSARKTRASAAAAAIPTAPPIAAGTSPRRRIVDMIPPRGAPSARRMPISRIRDPTKYDSVP
jgi:hypothetical protein